MQKKNTGLGTADATKPVKMATDYLKAKNKSTFHAQYKATQELFTWGKCCSCEFVISTLLPSAVCTQKKVQHYSNGKISGIW